MTNDNALTTVTGTAVEPYGAREEVREITDRLMALHPAAAEVGAKGMTAVAQLAVMSGANPLPGTGEIHIWMDRNRPVVDFGIAYYRRIAAEKDTVIWMDGHEPRAMNDRERQEHNIPKDALASICRGLLLSEYTALLDRGIPWQPAQKMLARTSIATVGKDEMFYNRDTKYNKRGDPRSAPTGRTWQWVCDKRAEKGFYRMKAMVDTTLTDAMKARTEKLLAQMEYEAGERPHYALVEQGDDTAALRNMSLDETNDLLYGDQNGVQRHDDDGAIEGEFEAVDDAPEVDEETGEILSEPKQDEAAAFERAIREARSPATAYAVICEHSTRYDHTKAVKGVMRLLGLGTLSRDEDTRFKQALAIIEYGRLRDSGMSQDDALASLDADKGVKQAPLFDEAPQPDMTYSE